MTRANGWLRVVMLATITVMSLAACGGGGDDKVTLRLGVSMTPAEMESFEQGLDKIRDKHPNWDIKLEATPQEGNSAKINSEIASKTLPDVQQISGLEAQGWIRQTVFENLDSRVDEKDFKLDDFWGGALEQFRWNDSLYAVPDRVAPDVIFYNKGMFDKAGVSYPTDDWTWDDLRAIAIKLTLDKNGHNPEDPDFDPSNVVQWGFNATPSHIWTRHMLIPLGGDPCANPDCTQVQFSSPGVQQAMQWWADLAQKDHAALYDPYGGTQTGVPGDPFAAGFAAMGFNGFFLVGQLKAAGGIDFDVVQPPAGPDGGRIAVLSSNGWAIPTTSKNKDAAWSLLQELTAPGFLSDTWAKPGHWVPGRKSAANDILNPASPPAHQQVILDALSYGEVLKPFTASAFEAYGKTAETFTAMMKGDISVAEGTAQIDQIANDILAKDRGE